MTVEKNKIDENKSVIIDFSGILDIDNVKDIKQEILDEFPACREITINLDKVTDIDLSAIQLFYSTYKTAIKKNKVFLIRWKNNETVKNKFMISSVFSGRIKAKRGER